jgi:hypothetical protein
MDPSYGKIIHRLTDKIEGIQRKFASLCYYLLFLFDIFRNGDLIVCYLNFRTLHCIRHVDALFLVKVFLRQINCPSITDTAAIHVPTRQIREFCTFIASSALRHGPSARCVIAANEVCRFLDGFGKKVVSFEDTSSIRENI